MNRFFDTVVRGLLDELGPAVIIEIGAAEGAHTERLLAHCATTGATLHAIDPAPSFEPDALAARHAGRLVFHRTTSFAALEAIPAADLVLIDGDHNYATVRRELELLAARARQASRPFPLVLLHDIGWPYARRDMYYDPTVLPRSARHPFARRGIAPREPGFPAEGGLNAHLCNAEREGGPRNGVLTAVEDFLADWAAAGPAPLELVTLPGFNGLGLLHAPALRERSPTLSRLAALLASGGLRAHVEALELERLEHSVTLARAGAGLEAAHRALVAVTAERDHLQRELARNMELVRDAHAQLGAIWRSPTWRVTRPLRALERAARAVRDRLRPRG